MFPGDEDGVGAEAQLRHGADGGGEERGAGHPLHRPLSGTP